MQPAAAQPHRQGSARPWRPQFSWVSIHRSSPLHPHAVSPQLLPRRPRFTRRAHTPYRIKGMTIDWLALRDLRATPAATATAAASHAGRA